MNAHKEMDTISVITSDNEGGSWIVTYADLVTLLLVFFILLFAISSLNLEKYKRAIRSIQISLGVRDPAVARLAVLEEAGDNPFAILNGSKSPAVDIESIAREELTSEDIMLQSINGDILIMIRDSVLFHRGQADLHKKSVPLLLKIAYLMKKYPEYHLRINGFTDNIPISTLRFPSNWELSAIRATSVLKQFIEMDIEPSRLSATGYGELLPLVPNDSAENRAKNRRVEFILEKKYH